MFLIDFLLTLPQLCAMIFFWGIEIAIVNFSNITHSVRTLMWEIQMVNYLDSLWMVLLGFLLNGKIESSIFHPTLSHEWSVDSWPLSFLTGSYINVSAMCLNDNLYWWCVFNVLIGTNVEKYHLVLDSVSSTLSFIVATLSPKLGMQPKTNFNKFQ